MLLLTGTRRNVKAHNGKFTSNLPFRLTPQNDGNVHHNCLLPPSGKIKGKKRQHEEFDFNHIHKRQMKVEVSLTLSLIVS